MSFPDHARASPEPSRASMKVRPAVTTRSLRVPPDNSDLSAGDNPELSVAIAGPVHLIPALLAPRSGLGGAWGMYERGLV